MTSGQKEINIDVQMWHIAYALIVSDMGKAQRYRTVPPPTLWVCQRGVTDWGEFCEEFIGCSWWEDGQTLGFGCKCDRKETKRVKCIVLFLHSWIVHGDRYGQKSCVKADFYIHIM